MTIDSRANSPIPIHPPQPLPHVSRRALKRVRDPIDIPTVCRYCSDAVRLVNNSAIYNGRSYGDWPYAYLCGGCKAYVGLHPDTDLPLGTLADKHTRDTRNTTKKAFEALWRDGYMTRSQAYAWLADKLGIAVADCHFGLFEPAQCRLAEAACMSYLRNPVPVPAVAPAVRPGKLQALLRKFS